MSSTRIIGLCIGLGVLPHVKSVVQQYSVLIYYTAHVCIIHYLQECNISTLCASTSDRERGRSEDESHRFVGSRSDSTLEFMRLAE